MMDREWLRTTGDMIADRRNRLERRMARNILALFLMPAGLILAIIIRHCGWIDDTVFVWSMLVIISGVMLVVTAVGIFTHVQLMSINATGPPPIPTGSRRPY